LDARNRAKVESKEMDKVAIEWRVGSRVALNVYEGDNPGRAVCQCHTTHDAERIVEAVNKVGRVGFKARSLMQTWAPGVWVICGAITFGIMMGGLACQIWFAH